MKKLVSLWLLAVFALSSLVVFPGDALAKKRKRYRGRYSRHRVIFKAYQEYFLSPTVKLEDQPVIVDTLREKGVNSVKVDEANNSLILQFKASNVSALDIMKSLKDLGYTVTSIN